MAVTFPVHGGVSGAESRFTQSLPSAGHTHTCAPEKREQ